MAKAFAQSIGSTFSRVQFTPDMLPSDISGVSIFNQKNQEFEFRPGPIHAQIVLADEVNRATPKTQAALLEAMDERQVTVDGTSYKLPNPFLVMATETRSNTKAPSRCPESQLDRFFHAHHPGLRDRQAELDIIESQLHRSPIEEIGQVVTADELQAAQTAIRDVYVDQRVREYLVDVVRSTRSHPDLYLGGSTRAVLALFRGSQTLADFRGRDYVIPRRCQIPGGGGMAHRLIVSPAARIRNLDTRATVGDILDSVPVPGATAA